MLTTTQMRTLHISGMRKAMDEEICRLVKAEREKMAREHAVWAEARIANVVAMSDAEFLAYRQAAFDRNAARLAERRSQVGGLAQAA